MILTEKEKHVLKIVAILLVFTWRFVLGADDFSLLKEKLKSDIPKERLEAIQKLSLSFEGLKVLIEHLPKEKDNYLKSQIIEFIPVSGLTEAFVAIVDQLKDENSYIRQVAVSSLGSFKEELAIPELKKVFTQEKKRSVKLAAVNVFRNFKSTQAVAELDTIIADEKQEQDVKMLAVQVLGNMKVKDTDKIKILKKHRNHPDNEIKKLINEFLKRGRR